jgi:hypothetical protein
MPTLPERFPVMLNHSASCPRLSRRRVMLGDDALDDGPFDDARLNGITTSTDGTTILVTFTGPGARQGGILALPAF